MKRTVIEEILNTLPRKIIGPEGNNYYLTMEADELVDGLRVFYKAAYESERVAERWFHMDEEQPIFKIEEMEEIIRLGKFRVLNLKFKDNPTGEVKIIEG